VRFWQLNYVLDRKGEPPVHHEIALLRRAIEGKAQPLGYSMLSVVLNRIRHPEENSNPKAGGKKSEPMPLARLRIPMGLVRLCINDIHRSKGVTEMSEGLDQSCAFPAYICGQLMYEYENLQRASNDNELNVSILDRYYSLASTYPALAFPKIAELAKTHLRKLRRDRPGTRNAIERNLLELHSKLQPSAAGAYPAKLSLEGQGLFALGYYHRKAWSIAQASSRKQSNESTDQNDTEEN